MRGIALARRLGDHLLPPPSLAAAEAGFTSSFRWALKSWQTVFFRNGSWPAAAVPNSWVALAPSHNPATESDCCFMRQERFRQLHAGLDFCLPHPRGTSNDNSGVFVRFRDPRRARLPGAASRTDVPGNAATRGGGITGYEIQIDEEARGGIPENEANGFPFNRTGAIYQSEGFRNSRPASGKLMLNAQRLASSVWHSCRDQGDRSDISRCYLNGRPATKFTADPADTR